MTIHTFSYQDKQLLIKHLARIYTQQNVLLHYHGKFTLKESDQDYGKANRFIVFIDDILELLTKEHKQILVNDFFQQKDRSWWTQYYSKTTYYRLKSTAMNEFLHCL